MQKEYVNNGVYNERLEYYAKIDSLKMYAKGKGSTVPSDAQAREKWVFEQLKK